MPKIPRPAGNAWRSKGRHPLESRFAANRMRGLLFLLVFLAASCPAGVYGIILAPPATTVSENITADTTWTLDGSPYIVMEDIYVYAPEPDAPAVTLTIEPGVEVRFESGTGLYIGGPWAEGPFPGALSARGSSQAPIVFTSSRGEPSPGDWKGVFFTWAADTDSCIMEHCRVTYGGAVHGGAIVVESGRPRLRQNTVSYSSHAGILVSNAEPLIACSTFLHNLYAIHTIGLQSAPVLQDNNFIGSRAYGIYHEGGGSLAAGGNWWGDPRGPACLLQDEVPEDYTGDRSFGSVAAAPPLSAPAECAPAPPENSPPLRPYRPEPADDAAGVVLSGDSAQPVQLSWKGGDPDTGDAVAFDVYFGSDPEALQRIAAELSAGRTTVSALAFATDYYWRVAAHDLRGAVVQGPLWHFATQPEPPAAVDGLQADGRGDGTSVALDWGAYDEAAAGGVSFYRIFAAVVPFSNVTGLEAVATVPAGTRHATVGGLARHTACWLAVVPVDEKGYFTHRVAAVSAVPEDVAPPEGPRQLSVQSLNDALVFSWAPSADSAGDLAGYRVFFGTAGDGELLPADRTSYRRGNLAPATGYAFRVRAVDADGNQSRALSATGVTLLPNPGGLTAQGRDGYAALTWQAAAPSGLVAGYRVYVSREDFDSVAGLTPALTTTATEAGVGGLVNLRTYHVAVTAVNLSGGETAAVETVAVTPASDRQGPEITDVRAGGLPLADGFVLRRAVDLTLTATDPSGVGQVAFSLDGDLLGTDYGGAPYTWRLDPLAMADGPHRLSITAGDTLGNTTTRTYDITTALDPPPAPVITRPDGHMLTGEPRLMVSGTAPADCRIILYNNGAPTGIESAVDDNGAFAVPLVLAEGANRIQAAARNRAGSGPLSDAVQVTLDTRIPGIPLDLSAASGAAGQVRLAWRLPEGAEAAGVDIYRSRTAFDAPAAARIINPRPLTAAAFDDLPPEDGAWHYRLAAVDAAGNRSALSQEAVAVSDSTAPRAERIEYFPQGPYDAGSGRMGPGLVDIRLTVSEPLAAAPFLSICPQNGSPAVITLTAQSERVYTGMWVIGADTPSGPAWAVFSGRDRAGNRGTEIDEGTTLQVDTAGPRVTRLDLAPPAPIRNDPAAPPAVGVVLGLDEPVRAGTRPQLWFSLSASGQDPVAIADLTEVEARPGEAQAWEARFELPAEAGAGGAESLSFAFAAQDDLGNAGGILAANRFQVYQGRLPPLAVPQGFAARALPGGRIRLEWQAVASAAGYRLFRRAPGEDEAAPYRRLENTRFTDEPAVDGQYSYAVASIRRQNGQESESGPCAEIAVVCDRQAPSAPRDLALELTARGIRAAWQAAPDPEPVTFRLYRSDAAQITDTAGLTPVARDLAQTTAIDSRPSATAHTYAVTAVDAAGNESPPSPSVYLNAGLLPVADIRVEQVDERPPEIRWTHPGGDLAGFDIYLGMPAQGLKLNDALLTAPQYTDGGYGGDRRTYTLVAVDGGGHPSLARSITLPPVSAAPAGRLVVRRGIMNRLAFVLENRGGDDVSGACLCIGLAGRDHRSETVDLPARGSATVSVPVGGYADLQDVEELTTTLEIRPHPDESVRIVRHRSVEVGRARLVLQILNESFTRGGSGRLRFSLQNTGPGEIELVTAAGSGGRPSPDIVLRLMDQDGNVLATAPFRQALGEGVTTLPGGDSVARIAAGGTFTSAAAQISVPAGAPRQVILGLDIAHLYYHHGRPDEVRMDGPATTRALALVDTSYDGEITGISPRISDGDQQIVIRGRAVARGTGEALAGVPLNLVITLDGFERSTTVTTGEDGAFAHRFTPAPAEGGTYRVQAVHPDLNDRPEQGTFVIRRLAVSPARIDLSVPRNYPKSLSLDVAAGSALDAANLRLVYDARDQPAGALPAGIHVTLPDPLASLAAGRHATLSFSVWADNSAPETDTLVLRVADDQNPAWARVTVRTHFSVAAPALFFSPDHVETGVSLADSVSADVRLENRGLAPLNDVTVELVSQAGNSIPVWAQLNSPAEQGRLDVGQQRDIRLSFSPDKAAAEGLYAFYLRVRAAEIAPADIGVYVAVTQDGQGGVLFKIADLYTGTQDGDGRIVQGLSGARVELQNEAVPTVSSVLKSDDFGEALFGGLPAGRYRYRVSAPRHQDRTGRVWIRPGMTTGESVFLEYDLVTVEWQVTETTVADRYDLVLKATYETDVPAPVVTAEPASVTLPPMRAGDIYNGEFALVNHGLVRADNLIFRAPAEDAYFAWELMDGLPDSLAAGKRATVAYRVICLQTPGQEGTGGGTCYDTKCLRIGYEWVCANGHCSRSAVYHCFSFNPRECGGSGGAIAPVHIGVGASGDSSGTASGPANPPPTVISGPQCFPKPVRRKCPTCSRRDSDHDRTQEALGTVDLSMRQYNRDRRDLRVRVPGGVVAAHRWYYDDAWHWEHRRHNLAFEAAADGGLRAVRSAGVTYEAALSGGSVFVHDVFRISRRDDGYRWSDPRGNWKTFDLQGRLTAYGTRRSTLARLRYEDGRLTGVSDRNDRQVLWYDLDEDGRITSVGDAAGRRVHYGYEDGRLTEATDVLGNTTTYAYDDRGRLAKITDAAGHLTRIGYDPYANVSSVADAEGVGWSFEYGYDEATRGTDVSIRSPGGSIRQVWFNRRGETERVRIDGHDIKTIVQDGRNLIVTDGAGNVTRKYFDEWGNLTRIIYPDGSQVAYEYEHLFNHLTQKTDERGMVTRYAYDQAGNLERKTEAAGTADERITEYTCDADGNRLSRRLLPDAQTDEALTTYQYDEDGNVAAITDPEGHTTTMTHDIAGNVLTRTDAAGRQWRYEYDAAGRLTAAVDPAGDATRYTYDAAGNLLSATDPLGHTKTFSWDGRHRLTRRTSAGGHASFFEYTPDGKMSRQTDAEGRFKRFEYDPQGRLTASIDGEGNTVLLEYAQFSDNCSTCSAGGAAEKPSKIIFPTFTREYRYDKRGRRTLQRDFLSDTESLASFFEYDPAGNMTARTDPEDHTTRYSYDALNRLVSVTDAAAGEIRYRYDSRNNLIELTDAEGHTTHFAYDRLDHLVSETRPLGGQIRYRYDETGALSEKIDADGRKTLYSYDPAGRLIRMEHFAQTGDSRPAKTIVFEYDAAGNQIACDDGSTSFVYRYDADNRKVAESIDYGVFQLNMAYEYYRNGLKKSFTAPDGTTCRYRYDQANRLAAVEIPGQGSITFTRYTWNKPAGILFPGGGTQTRAYDPLMRPTTITVQDPARNSLMNYRYTYDKAGNIITKETGHGTFAYTYDALYRLLEAQNPTLPDESYTYDAVGNRLTSADTAGTWQYNADNELEKAGDATYTYSASGGMIARTAKGSTTRFFYNPEGRLSRVEDPAGTTIEYGYDPFGRRLWKEVDGTRTWFVYSDEGLIGEYTDTGTPIRTYGYKPSTLWTSDPLFLKTENTYYFYQNDHLGTPQKLTAPNGAIAWSATYTSFGQTTVDPKSTISNPLRFPGQYFDMETRFHYNLHRYYFPFTGRFSKPDPIGLRGGINPFLYAKNNPLTHYDYTGLWCGSGWTEWIVPDKPAGYDFSEACRRHDRCYAGLPDENGHDQCHKGQRDCDADFYENMKEICARESNDETTYQIPERSIGTYLSRSRSRCEETAWIYWIVVSYKGVKPYARSREHPSCICNQRVMMH